MCAVLHRVILSLTVFLALLGDASGRAVLQPDEQALWPFGGRSAAQGTDTIPGGFRNELPSGERSDVGMEVGPNLYAYVRCNPWSKFDPLGLDTVDTIWDFAFGVAGRKFNPLYAPTQAFVRSIPGTVAECRSAPGSAVVNRVAGGLQGAADWAASSGEVSGIGGLAHAAGLRSPSEVVHEVGATMLTKAGVDTNSSSFKNGAATSEIGLTVAIVAVPIALEASASRIAAESEAVAANKTGYRAVSKAELDDIAENGFRPHPEGRSMQDKWFSESREGAEAFKKTYPELEHVVEAKVPKSVYDTSHKHPNIDQTGPGFAVPAELQPKLKPKLP